MLQWTAYHGQYLTVAIWAALVAALVLHKAGRASSGAGCQSLGYRDRAGAVLRSIGGPSLKLSVLTLVAYLALVPNILERVEREFHRNMAFARQPSDHWQAVEKAVQQVQSDEQRMVELKAIVNAEMLEETNRAAASAN